MAETGGVGRPRGARRSLAAATALPPPFAGSDVLACRGAAPSGALYDATALPSEEDALLQAQEEDALVPGPSTTSSSEDAREDRADRALHGQHEGLLFQEERGRDVVACRDVPWTPRRRHLRAVQGGGR